MPFILRSSFLLFSVTSAGLAASWLINTSTLESVRSVPAIEVVVSRAPPLLSRFDKDDVLAAVARQSKTVLADLPSRIPVPIPRDAGINRSRNEPTHRAEGLVDFQSCLPACETRDRLAEANIRPVADHGLEADEPSREWHEVAVAVAFERSGELEILRAIASNAMRTTRRIVEAPMNSPLTRW